MTALKPIENRKVRAVASERYPLNKTCAHPDCKEEAVDPHHAFPRSSIGGDSWFVGIDYLNVPSEEWPNEGKDLVEGILTIPHVTGLCRAHHDNVEQHDAWIRLEDGVWEWYVRDGDDWGHLGALNPQPGSVEGKPKRKRFQGEARKTRKTISVRVPDGAQENGAEVWDTLVEEVRAKYAPDLGWDEDVPVYFVITAALAAAIQ